MDALTAVGTGEEQRTPPGLRAGSAPAAACRLRDALKKKQRGLRLRDAHYLQLIASSIVEK
jgi:hypothetical protein